VSEIVNLHKLAFKNSLNVLAGNLYLRSFFRWFNNNSQAILLVATVEGKPIGYVCGAPFGYERKINIHLFIPAIIGLMLHPRSLINKQLVRNLLTRLKIVFSGVNPKISKFNIIGKGISLVAIAVHPEYLGTGVSTHLIKEFEKQSTYIGYDFNRLSVYKENFRARRFYEKNGWRIFDENDSPLLYFKMNDKV
jgi:ribosomal protein S18 acetylase RimI-like enzyme